MYIEDHERLEEGKGSKVRQKKYLLHDRDTENMCRYFNVKQKTVHNIVRTILAPFPIRNICVVLEHVVLLSRV